MEVDVPAPAFTSSTPVRANFRRAVWIALGFVAALALRHLDIPPRIRCEWEDEAEDIADE